MLPAQRFLFTFADTLGKLLQPRSNGGFDGASNERHERRSNDVEFINLVYA